MVLYFVISNLVTAGVQTLWHIPAARSFFRIPTLLRQPSTGAPQQGFMETFKHAYKTSLNEAQSKAVQPSAKEHERNLRKTLRKAAESQ